MIKSVKKMREGVYVINDDIIVSDFDFKDDHLEFKIDYDENKLTEEEAQKTADEFVIKAMVAQKQQNDRNELDDQNPEN